LTVMSLNAPLTLTQGTFLQIKQIKSRPVLLLQTTPHTAQLQPPSGREL